MTGDLNMNNNKITNVGDPTLHSDAVNKIYLLNTVVKPSDDEDKKCFSVFNE